MSDNTPEAGGRFKSDTKEYFDVPYDSKQFDYMNAQKLKNPTPEQRAAELWSHMQLHNPRVTAWDLICFCVETLGVFASEYTFLQENVKSLVSIVYTAHQHMDNMPSCLLNESTTPTKDSEPIGGESLTMESFDLL